jgi:hypothetical protein
MGGWLDIVNPENCIDYSDGTASKEPVSYVLEPLTGPAHIGIAGRRLPPGFRGA